MTQDKKKRINPAIAWCFTLNNYTKEEHGALVRKFQESQEEYLYIVGEEIGEEGTPHLQGYVEKRTGRFRPIPKFQVVRNNNANAVHFEKAKGNRTQNYKYCSKDGKFVTNIRKPTMSYTESKHIWEETKGITNDTYTREDIEEAAIHIQFVEDLPCMTEKESNRFLNDYKEMMKRRYPDVTAGQWPPAE